MATAQEIVKSFMNSLSLTTKTGTTALDEAIRTATNNTFSSLSDLRTQFLNDITTVNDSNTFLKEYCGIILKNNDTGAITGSDAGNGLVKTKESTVLETDSVDDWAYVAPGSTVTLSSGLKVNMPSKRDDGSALTANDLFILKALPHWLEAGIKLNKESYGLDFSSTGCNIFNVSLYYEENGALASTPTTISSSTGKATVAGVKINTYHYSNLDTTDENGKDLSSGQKYLDRTIVHELNHAILAANVKNVSLMPSYITEGSAELVHGVDDTRPAISVLAGNADLMDKALYNSGNWAKYPTVTTASSNGNITLNAPAYAGGYTLWRYMAKQAATSYTKTFNGTDDAETFETANDGVTINGAGGNDSLLNGFYLTSYSLSGGDNVSLNGGADDDYLYNMQGKSVTLLGGTGNDQAHSYKGETITADLGTGNDYFNAYQSKNVTALGGDGDDTLKAIGGENFYYDAGSGNDSILGAGTKATLIGGADDDTINLSSGGGYNLIIYKNNDGNDLIQGISSTDTLSIDGAEATRTSLGNDLIFGVGSGSITVNGGANVNFTLINDFTPTGVTLTNTEANKLFEGTDYDDNLTNRGNYVTIKAFAGNDVIINDFSNNASIDGGAGNDSIDVNYSSNITIDGGDGDDTIDSHGSIASIVGGAGKDLIFNSSSNATINAGAGDDTISLNRYAEGYIALIEYAESDGNDYITGFNETSTLKIGNGTGSYSAETLTSGDVIVTVGEGKITLTGAATLDALNIDGEEQRSDTLMLTNDDAAKVTIDATIKNADATARTSAIRLVGNALDNSLFGGSGKDTLYGKDGNDYIAGNAGNDKLYGQNGDDTLWGGSGNDTLTGGAGDDLFVYTAGNDFIADYAEGDKISVNAAISASSVKGANATFTIGENTLTVKNGKGAEIVFVEADGNERTIIGGAFVATNSTSAKNTLAAWREVADATARTTAIRIVGNALDNSILGGSGKDTLYGKDGDDYLEGNAGNDKLYGQNGDDTLWGGIGNDTLTGGDGKDVFIYASGEGKDVINGFDNNDMLLITGAFSASYDTAAKMISFTVDSVADAIKIKNFTATTFNVNGLKYRIKGDNFVRK